jgi:hypothetical protein
MPKGDFAHGFVLSDTAQYAFLCQEVYQDVVAFAAAIPSHLRPLFLIPVKLETVVASDSVSRVASFKTADDFSPSGDTQDADLFGTKTFVNYDVQPNIPQSSPGSIFDIDGADEITHHQEYNYDENIQAPSDTSYMSDIDMTQYTDYPYRTKEKPVRHSFDIKRSISAFKSLDSSALLAFRKASSLIPSVVFSEIAIKPEALIPRTPDKIKKNAASCNVSLTSYDKKTKVFNFNVTGGKSPHSVKAFLSDIDQVALSCDCPFWRWNGPEYHAKSDDYMLGQSYGTAGPPNVRDPDREYFLCKHTYAVLKRLDSFIGDIVDENWDLDDAELMKQVDEDWDRLSISTKIPLGDLEQDDITLQVDWSNTPEDESEEDESEEDESEEDESEEDESEEDMTDYEVSEEDGESKQEDS